MGIRKLPLRRLARWSQIRQRNGAAFMLVGRYVDGEIVTISIHATLAEVTQMQASYMSAREADASPRVLPQLVK